MSEAWVENWLHKMSRALAQFFRNNNKIDGLPYHSIKATQSLINDYSVYLESKYPYLLPQYKAYIWVLHRLEDDTPLDFIDIASMHYCIYKHISTSAGMIRDSNKIIRKYQCPKVDHLPNMLEKFNALLSVSSDISKYDSDTQNSYYWYVHNVFQCIQPFESGNGRVGRFLFNTLRMKNSMNISHWDVDKYFYYNAVKKFEKTFKEKYSDTFSDRVLDKG